MADPNQHQRSNPLGGNVNPGHQAKSKHKTNVIGNAHEQLPVPDSVSERMQVDAGNKTLSFNMPAFENKKTVTVEEFKKLCGSSSRLYDVMKFRGKLCSIRYDDIFFTCVQDSCTSPSRACARPSSWSKCLKATRRSFTRLKSIPSMCRKTSTHPRRG